MNKKVGAKAKADKKEVLSISVKRSLITKVKKKVLNKDISVSQYIENLIEKDS